jgi:MoaA/NifB/PqqE/SkfB family radical SAM enzyme
MCYSKKIILPEQDNVNMSFEKFRHIIDTVKPVSVNMAANGEPFLNSEFLHMVAYAGERKIKTITSSNFVINHAIIEEVAASSLDILKISIDGATKETYEKIRGKNHAALMENLRRLFSAKARRGTGPEVRFDFVIQKDNYSEIIEYIDFCYGFGVRHVYFHPLDIREYEAEKKQETLYNIDLRQLEALLRQALEKAQGYGMSTNLPTLLKNHRILKNLHSGGAAVDLRRSVCLLPWLGMFITVTGDVSPCCAVYPGRDGAAGNIFKENIDAVWNGPKMRGMRRLFKTKKNYDALAGCGYCMPMALDTLVAAARTFPNYLKKFLLPGKEL